MQGIIAIAALGLLVSGPAAAQRAGLLLGSAGDSSIWIAVRGDTVGVRRGPGLLVPRRDGFWQLRWVGAACPARVVDIPVGSGSGGAVGLTAAPLGRRAPLPVIANPVPCRSDYRGEGDETVGDSAALRFVGTDHVVLGYHYSNEGESAQTRLHVNAGVVLALDDLGRAGFALEEWDRESAAPLGPDLEDSLFTLCEERAAEQGNALLGTTRVLGLGRVAGRWAYDARVYSDCSMCNNDVEVCPLGERPPRELVGFDSLTVAWSAIVRRVPQALDVFTSPRGDVAVVRDSTALQVFRAAGGMLTDRLAVVPLRATSEIVSAQWALGASVRRWDGILAPVLGESRRGP